MFQRSAASQQRRQLVHPLSLPPELQTNKQQRQSTNTKWKRSSNTFIRYTLGLILLLVFVPIVYVYHILDIKHIKTPSTVHKSLKDFQQQQNNGIAPVIQKTTDSNGLILTAYLESPETLTDKVKPLPIRKTSANRLEKVTFPSVKNCSTLMQEFPIDNYPLQDPFLPWIHDYFPSQDNKYIQFVAQNRRRCDTGEDEIDTMKFWEPQISLFQTIPIVVYEDDNESTKYRLASSFQEATHNATRFQCRFHHGDSIVTTLSVFPFDYEYVTWRKGNQRLFKTKGKEVELFWLSQLLFSCPVPEEFQSLLNSKNNNNLQRLGDDSPAFHVDLIPIRTPARTQYLFTPEQTGSYYSNSRIFDLENSFGNQHILPEIDDAGRWQNLPICPRSDIPSSTLESDDSENQKPYRMVACTWTSSSYTRRGDAVRVSDSAQRLREWITFHLMVGVDHVYIYDNTDIGSGDVSELREVAESFGPEKLTYHVWPYKICNNNRPAHKNPGERSSQYGAEASCRTRYGDLTEWMTFLVRNTSVLMDLQTINFRYFTKICLFHYLQDTDEYMVSILLQCEVRKCILGRFADFFKSSQRF